MSKQADDVDTGKEIARLNELLRKKEHEIKGFRGREAMLKNKFSEKKPESSPETPVVSQNEPAQVPHVYKFFQRFCTTPGCGGENPEFKDETKCGSCGMHTGALDEALKMEKCPSCGGKQVVPITPEAIAKAKEMVKVE